MRLVLIWCLLYLHLHAIIVYCTCIRRHLRISGLPSWLNCFNPKTWFRDISSYGSHDHLFLACSFGHTLQNLHGIWTPPQQDMHIIYQTSTKLVCKLQVETFSKWPMTVIIFSVHVNVSNVFEWSNSQLFMIHHSPVSLEISYPLNWTGTANSWLVLTFGWLKTSGPTTKVP